MGNIKTLNVTKAITVKIQKKAKTSMLPTNKRKEAQHKRIKKRFSGTPRTFLEEEDNLVENQKPTKSGWDPYWVILALTLAWAFGWAAPWVPILAIFVWIFFS